MPIELGCFEYASQDDHIMSVLAVVQKKGGTGKTTTATDVSVAAMTRGFSVVFIDIGRFRTTPATGLAQ